MPILGGVCPVPETGMASKGVSGSLLVTVSVPDMDPTVVGVKAMVTSTRVPRRDAPWARGRHAELGRVRGDGGHLEGLGYRGWR